MMRDLEQFIRDLNETWRNQRFDDLYDYFHKVVVMLPPGSSQPVVGIETMVQSYRQFGSMATIHGFHIKDLTTYGCDSVAICHLRFEIDYEIETGRFQEEGLEIYVVETAGARPKVVWRTQIALSADDA